MDKQQIAQALPRRKLAAARASRGWSQETLADKIQTSRVSVSRWETGESDPSAYFVNRLLEVLEVAHPHHIDIFAPGEDIMEITRREAIEQFLTAAGIPFIVTPQGIQLVSKPIPPEEFLGQCNASMKACWQLMQHNGFATVELMLSASTPRLAQLASESSKYQRIAASLATEAKILQLILAGHRLDLVGRELYCLDAVRYGELSGNRRIHAIAMTYLGYHHLLYTHNQGASEAIHVLNKSLASIDNDAWLLKSAICMGMAGAHAQNKEETQALEMASQARLATPKHPERDPYYTLIDIGPQELDQLEGRTYLYLAEHFPNKDYAQCAYDAFERGTNKQAIAARTQSETLIHKADAIRALGDMDEFIKCLERGTLLGIEIDSKVRYNEALVVFRKTPEDWQKEGEIQRLQRDLFNPQTSIIAL